MASLKELAAALVRRLKEEGFVIQRYDAYSTNSIYLKLDYGVCNSIRISDHKGKKHLAYRYNLILGCTSPYFVTTQEGWVRHFFPAEMVDRLIDRILKDRKLKIKQYGTDRYGSLMAANQIKHRNDKGFWRQSQIV